MAETDLLTLEEGKRAINMPEQVADLDEGIALVVSGVTELIEDECGPVVAREVVERPRHSGNGVLRLAYPVVSITSVVEWASAGTSTTLTAEDDDTKPQYGFLLVDGDTVNATLLRRSSGSTAYWDIGDRNVVVTYQAGRCADTDSVPMKFKLAASAIAAAHWHLWAPAWAKNRDFSTDPDEYGTATPPADMVRALLPQQLLPPSIG